MDTLNPESMLIMAAILWALFSWIITLCGYVMAKENESVVQNHMPSVAQRQLSQCPHAHWIPACNQTLSMPPQYTDLNIIKPLWLVCLYGSAECEVAFHCQHFSKNGSVFYLRSPIPNCPYILWQGRTCMTSFQDELKLIWSQSVVPILIRALILTFLFYLVLSLCV